MNSIRTFALFLAGSALFTTQAHALLIQNPPATTGLAGPTVWTGTSNQNPKADDVENITGFAGELTELYKANTNKSDPANPIEEKALASSYKTTFSNPANDPANALIEYTGGPSISGTVFLLVKDGNNAPYWYIYNLTVDGAGPGLDWNGTDVIDLRNFWPSNGAISHVSLFATTTTTTSVPDGASTLALLGLALGGLGFLGRRLRK